MKANLVTAFALLAVAGAGACDAGEDCTLGLEGCPCAEMGICLEGLQCLSNKCVDPGAGFGGNAGTGGAGAGFGGAGAGTGGTAGDANTGGNAGLGGAGAGGVGGGGAGFGGSVSSGGTGVGGSIGEAGAGGAVSIPGQVPIPFAAGWVDASENSVGIQGSWYTFSDIVDGGASTISPSDFATAGTEVCVQGTAAQVFNGNFALFSGATLGLNLQQEEGLDTALPYDAVTNGVTGFAFKISQLPAGGELRFTVKVSGNEASYCDSIRQTGLNAFRFSDLVESCWLGTPSAPPDASSLEALHFQVVTNELSSYAFAFCISELYALTQ